MQLRLENNRFAGVIPPELGALAALEDIGLQNNEFNNAFKTRNELDDAAKQTLREAVAGRQGFDLRM